MSSPRDPAWRDTNPPGEALRWAESALGAGWRVSAVRALRGGLSHATHRLDCGDGQGATASVVLRRWARPGWRDEDPEFTAQHEANCLGLVAQAGVPAPRLLAVDADAEHCDVPAVLQSFVVGAPPAAVDGAMLDSFAQVLSRIHAVDTDAARAVALPFTPYYELHRITVPAWVHDAGLWRAALETVSGDLPPPGDGDRFLHRDFHPGNTLWHAGALSGVLDWDRGSWGSAALDVAHMAWNLAVLHGGVEVAARFVSSYRRATGRVLGDLAWWQLRDALDALPEVAAEWGTARVAAMEGFVRDAARRVG